MKYGLIGEHPGSGWLAEMHAAFGNREYEQLDLPPEELENFLRKADFSGINVTDAYGGRIMPYLDRVSVHAQRAGTADTVVRRDGKLVGYNTGYTGILEALERMGIRSASEALVAGSGGLSRTACEVLKSAGVRRILPVSGAAGEGGDGLKEAASEHADAELIMNAAKAETVSDEDGIPLDPECFPSLRWILDAEYRPIRSNLVLEGERRGIPSEGGLYMLAARAACANKIFFGEAVGKERTETVFRSVRMRRQNIVLIGMPSSGKSTVGEALAGMTGKRLVSTDQMIEERIGMRIADYIASRGESAFREMEREAVLESCRLSGVIIATGGGSILRADNTAALKRNGMVFFLDRSLGQLTCSEDRPLSSTPEKLIRMYRERMPVYRASADCILPKDADPDAAARRIWEEFGK